MATTAATSVQPHLKRKQSTAGISNGGRNVKRRASKACHCCRSRKVRCDVVESGIPCTNCRLDEVECLVTEGKRRRKSYVDGDMLGHRHSPSASTGEEKELPLFTSFDDIEGLNDITLSLDGMGDGSNLVSLENGLAEHRPHMLCKFLNMFFSDQSTDGCPRSDSRSSYEFSGAFQPNFRDQPENNDSTSTFSRHRFAFLLFSASEQTA
jgi:hypothetical protein